MKPFNKKESTTGTNTFCYGNSPNFRNDKVHCKWTLRNGYFRRNDCGEESCYAGK